MIGFIIGFFIGAFSGIVLICLAQVAKSGDEIESNFEEIDYTTIYLNGFYNGEAKWKVKIKEKINALHSEKLEERVCQFYTPNKKHYWETDAYNKYIEDVLNDLLKDKEE